MGHIKMDCKNIFNTKKDTYHISFQSVVWSLPYLPFSRTVINLHWGVEWGSFLKNFQKAGWGNCLGVSMILYVVFVAIELPPDTIFFQHFLASQYINYIISTHTQSLKKGFSLVKVDIHFSFLLTYSLPSQESKYFSWNFRIVKKWKQVKSISRKSIPWKVSKTFEILYFWKILR